jgi:GT2 family glycosyltransferase
MSSPTQIDIIILSYAKDEDLKKLTEETIASLVSSEDPAKIQFNILVIESNSILMPYQFEYSKTIYTGVKFGYNRYMNIGIKATKSPYICLCNNDLIFHKGWASNILTQMRLDKHLKSASPYCEITHKNSIKDDGQNVVSTRNGILIGWCIFLKREILKVIGPFDENLTFWFADNDYGNTLEKYQVKHALVTSSKVTHIGSKSHAILSDDEKFEYTYGQFLYYDLKWNHKSKTIYYLEKLIMPIFKYFYIRRYKSRNYMFFCSLLSKLYGGFK